MRQDRRETNPAFSSRKLKLGTFQTNLDSGCVMSDLDGRLAISWPSTLALAQLAEEMELEALVPVARWHGWGGKTNPQGPGFEAYTWAAGISASVPKVGVVSTSHITINHPIIAAKQCAAIDHISNGRFILNIVTGWVQPEIEMFGQPMLGHEERYACAEEWLAIVKRLWTEDESFDHEGRFYKIKKGYLAPKPIQYPHPAIMNAGASELAVCAARCHQGQACGEGDCAGPCGECAPGAVCNYSGICVAGCVLCALALPGFRTFDDRDWTPEARGGISRP